MNFTAQVRLAARVTVQQVTCRTSPTGECGKLLAVPERGQASCLSRCWFSASKIFNFLKMLTREISTTCRSPSKWKSWLKTLLWLSHLCFFSGKALLQHIWTFIQEKEKRYELKKLHALWSNLRQEYFWFDSCNYLLCMFWVGQSRNTPHGQSSDDTIILRKYLNLEVEVGMQRDEAPLKVKDLIDRFPSPLLLCESLFQAILTRRNFEKF